MNNQTTAVATRDAKWVGRKFGRLTIVSFSRNAVGGAMWNCNCDCGGSAVVKIGKLTTGGTQSCGCLRRETTSCLKLKHGFARANNKHPIYERWKGIIARCSDPKHRSFNHYGARGVSVCPRWHSFDFFLADMGTPPTRGLQIDRINNDGNYEPGNCRWVTPKVNSNNRRPRRPRKL